MLRDIRAAPARADSSRADLLDAPNDFRLNIDSTINPGVLAPARFPELQQISGRMGMAAPARRSSRPSAARIHDPATWQGDGRSHSGGRVFAASG